MLSSPSATDPPPRAQATCRLARQSVPPRTSLTSARVTHSPTHPVQQTVNHIITQATDRAVLFVNVHPSPSPTFTSLDNPDSCPKPSSSPLPRMLAPSQAYYKAHDLAPTERAASVLPLYSPAAKITWNGNPVAYSDLPALLGQLPESTHEVQAFDSHPLAGTSHPPLSSPAVILLSRTPSDRKSRP